MAHHQYSCLSGHIDLPGRVLANAGKQRNGFRLAALICALVVTGCGGGGGGSLGSSIAAGSSATGNPASSQSNSGGSSGSTGGSGTGSTGGSSSGSSGSTATSSGVVCCADTGITGSVEAPAPASFGASPLPAQIATPGGPTFDSKSGPYPIGNVSFPALSSSLQFTSSGLSAVSTNQSATVTVIGTSGIGSTLQLIVPSINLDTTWSQDGNLPGTIEGSTYGLSYVVLGEHAAHPDPPHTMRSVTEFAFGYETPAGAMPTTGQADFSGHAQGSIWRKNVCWLAGTL